MVLTLRVICLLAHHLVTLIIVWVFTPLPLGLNMLFGTYTFASGSKYVGEFKDGKYSGQGTYTTTNGYTYVGEFKDGKRNGQGTATFADGDKYVGEWKDDKLNGQGAYTFADGSKYVGEWKDDKFNGQGTLFASNGLIINQGIFADNKFVPAYRD